MFRNRYQAKTKWIAAQSTLETTVLIVIAVVALVLMQTYLKRGIQGHLRSGVDSIGGQYDPERTTSDIYSNHVSNSTTSSLSDERDVPIPDDPYGQSQRRTIAISSTRIHYDNTISSSSEYVAPPAP